MLLNDSLNKHARRFLQKLESEVFVDFVDDPAGGGPGPEGFGTGRRGNGHEKKDGNNGSGGGEGAGGTNSADDGSQKHRRPKFPHVLLSGVDADPANASGENKAP